MESMVNLKVLQEEFKDKKVFITGHSGFKGAWFTYLLDYVGAVTFGYSLSPNTKPSLYSSLASIMITFSFCSLVLFLLIIQTLAGMPVL